MTVPMNGVREPNFGGAGGSQMGPAYVQAQVMSVDVEQNIALCRDSLSRMLSVRLDVQRSKGSMPEVGETWIVDKYYGIWTFAALMRGGTQGVTTPIENVHDLAPTLDDHQGQLNDQADLMAGSQITIKITNVQGGSPSNKRYVDGTLSDGTAVTTVPVAGPYYPTVGDTAWVLRQPVPNNASSTPQLICIGQAGLATGLPLGQGQTIRPQLVAESVLYLMADKRLAPSTTGGPYQIARGFIDVNGNPQYGSWIDTVQYALGGGEFTVLERNNVRNVGIYWGNGEFYFTKGDGTGRVALRASSVGLSDGGGVGIGADPYGNPAVILTAKNLAIVGGQDGVYITNAANTARADLRAQSVWALGGVRAETGLSTGGVFVVDGQTTFNGGVIGHQGALFDGLPLRCISFTTNGFNPAGAQVMSTDGTFKGNIAVDGTFYYRGAAQPVAASERDLKEHIENLGDPWGFINSIVAARYTWKDTEFFDDRPHVGLYVNEMAEADPDTILQMPKMPREMHGLDDDGNPDIGPVIRYNSNIGRSYEDRAVIAYLVRALQLVRKELDELSKPA